MSGPPWLALALAWACQAPFADAQGRFTVDLPAGWQPVAGSSDARGAMFRCQDGPVLVQAAVRLMPLGGPVSLDAFAARIAAASDQESGFRMLGHGTGTLAGQPMRSRRYVVFVNNERRLSKIVEQRILIAGDTGIVLHAETLAASQPTVARAFAHFFGSLTLGRPAPHSSAEALAAAAAPAAQRRLAGTWRGGDHTMVLTATGEATLDGVAGRFHLDHGVMVLMLTAGEQIVSYALAGDTLRLSGAVFGDGQVLTRSR